MLNAILKHPDHLFYLLIGFAIANGDVVVDDAQPFVEPCKAAHKLGTIIYPGHNVAYPNRQTRSSYR